MKILKIEVHDYSIITINDGEKYYIYRRFNENKWEIFRREQWKLVEDNIELEKVFKENKKL
jgi:hypothetical protein